MDVDNLDSQLFKLLILFNKMKEEVNLKNLIFFSLILVIFNSAFCLSLDSEAIISEGGDNELIVDYSGDQELFFIGPDPNPPQITIISPTATTYSSSGISFEVSASENSTCNYTLDSGAANYSMTANSSGTGFTASQTLSNAVYTSQFYCWDLLNNLNNTENVTFTVSVSAGAPVVSGGGGTSSGAVAPPAPPKTKFIVSPNALEKTVVLNRMEFGEIEIRNQENTKTDFNITIEVLEEIILLDETEVSIKPNQKEKIGFRVYAPKDAGVYPGKIIISAGNTIKEVFVIINVKTEKGLFDVTLLIPRSMKTIDVGESLSAQIDLLQMGLKEKIDVTLNYVIKDFAGNTHLLESETLAVYDQKSISKDFHTEELEPGDYVLGTELIYPDGVAVASSQFKVRGEDEVETDSLMMISLISGLMFILALMGFAIHRYKKIGKKLRERKKK